MGKTLKEQFETADTKGGIRKETKKGMMWISTPTEIREYFRKAPKDKLILLSRFTNDLKKKHNVDFVCPLTAGIFFSIVAGLAHEEGDDSVHWWKVIKPGGKLYDKYLGRFLPQEELLKADGYKIVRIGKNKIPAVENFEEFLWE